MMAISSIKGFSTIVSKKTSGNGVNILLGYLLLWKKALAHAGKVEMPECWSFNGSEPGGPESMMRKWKKERG